jgi:hypothetical protein
MGGTNKTLKGHKLLIITPWDPPAGFLEGLKSQFPDLETGSYTLIWGQKVASFAAEEWKDVTIVLTFDTLPTPEQAPKIEYVQLISAGANHILQTPLFTDTDVSFCTANGVHGWVPFAIGIDNCRQGFADILRSDRKYPSGSSPRFWHLNTSVS